MTYCTRCRCAVAYFRSDGDRGIDDSIIKISTADFLDTFNRHVQVECRGIPVEAIFMMAVRGEPVADGLDYEHILIKAIIHSLWMQDMRRPEIVDTVQKIWPVLVDSVGVRRKIIEATQVADACLERVHSSEPDAPWGEGETHV